MRHVVISILSSRDAMTYPLIEATNIVKRFGSHTVLSDLNFNVEKHEHIALVGPSGCGKSTLLSIICGLGEQTEGEMRVYGETEPEQRLAHCAWMPQHDLLFPWLTVAQNAALALTNQHVNKRTALTRVRPYLKRFGIEDYANQPPYAMSGGMRQRASFVRTMITGKDVLLLDEPFGSLDSITRNDLQEWLHQTLHTMQSTSILVTHDVEEALILSDRVVVMSRNPGRILREVPGYFSRQQERSSIVADIDFVEAREQIVSHLRQAQTVQS